MAFIVYNIGALQVAFYVIQHWLRWLRQGIRIEKTFNNNEYLINHEKKQLKKLSHVLPYVAKQIEKALSNNVQDL
jgi:hypothetical protein